MSNTTLVDNLLYVPSYSFGKYEKALTAVCEKKVAQRKPDLLAATECANFGKNSSLCADKTNLSVAVRLKQHFKNFNGENPAQRPYIVTEQHF